MATILVNKFFHEMNGSVDTSLEPLNEIYFDQNLDMIELEQVLDTLLKQVQETMKELNRKYYTALANIPYTSSNNGMSPQQREELENRGYSFNDMVYTEAVKIKTGRRKTDENNPEYLRHQLEWGKNDIMYDLLKSPQMTKVKSLIKKIFGFAQVHIEKGVTRLAGNLRAGRGNTQYYNEKMKNFINPAEADISDVLPNLHMNRLKSSRKDYINKIFANKYNKIKDLDDTHFIDDYGNDIGLITNIGERVLELKKDKKGRTIGIRFNRKLIKINFNLLIGNELFEVDNGRELVAIILHEIGHSFSNFIIQNKLEFPTDIFARINVTSDSRADEMFSDQFVAMYGYGPDLIRVLIKFASTYYSTDTEFNQAISGARQNPTDMHPVLINRLKRIMSQLYIDLKDPNLSAEVKRRLQADIDKAQNLLSTLKQNKFAYVLARAEKGTKFDKKARRIANPAKFNNFKFLER